MCGGEIELLGELIRGVRCRKQGRNTHPNEMYKESFCPEKPGFEHDVFGLIMDDTDELSISDQPLWYLPLIEGAKEDKEGHMSRQQIGLALVAKGNGRYTTVGWIDITKSLKSHVQGGCRREQEITIT